MPRPRRRLPDRTAQPRLTPRDRRLLAASLTVFLGGLLAVLSTAPHSTVTVDGDRVLLSGTIVSRTPGQVARAVARHPEVEVLEQTQVWGSVDSFALDRLGRSVRRAGLATHLGPGAEVYSGGAVLFLAGADRTMEDGAVIGVHAWRDPNGVATDFPRGSALHDPERSFVEDMLGSDAFYWFYINAAPPSDMHVMTDAEIARFGLLTAPATAPDAPAP